MLMSYISDGGPNFIIFHPPSVINYVYIYIYYIMDISLCLSPSLIHILPQPHWPMQPRRSQLLTPLGRWWPCQRGASTERQQRSQQRRAQRGHTQGDVTPHGHGTMGARPSCGKLRSAIKQPNNNQQMDLGF